MFRSLTTFDPETKIWSGIESEDIFNHKLTIGHVLLYMMNNDPNKVIQISDDTGVQLTNNDIRIRSIQAAQFFQKNGLKEGDNIGLLAKNSDNLTPIILGALLCGIVVNGLFPSFGKDDVASSFNETKPKVIFCDDDNYDVIRQVLNETDLKPLVYTINKKIENVRHITEFIHEEKDNSVDNFKFPTLSDARNVPAVIMYSSGTTGPPKGIFVSHATLLSSVYPSDISSEDILFTFGTINAFSTYWMIIIGLLRGATRIITTRNFTPELWLEIVDRHKVTVPVSAPSFFAILLRSINNQKTSITSLKSCIIGGGLLNQHVVTEANLVLPKCKIINIYGTTETGSIALNDKVHKSGSVGKLAFNVKAKIINNDGVPVGPGHYGEVLIHPQFPFLGYYGRPKETKEAYDDEGWVHTGDIGYFDEHKDLVLVNRKKDLLKNQGFEYFPSEIEDIIMEMPEVNQACIAGVPDGKGNDLPTALVVKKITASLSEKQVLLYATSKLKEFKQLKGGVFFVNALPLSYAGKYKRDIAKTMATDLYNQRLQSNGGN